MVRLLANRNRLKMKVRGTSRSCALKPVLRTRYSRNATISAPKKVDSEKMKALMPTIGVRQRASIVGRGGAAGGGTLCTTSHSGRWVLIGGSAVAKFSGGGGDVVAHSSVHAFHGLSGARSVPRSAWRMFHSS